MQRKPIILLASIITLILFTHSVDNVHAQFALPQSDWYAVIWNRTDDTLHWVNDATEIVSMARPKLPGEGDGADLYISPNGRWMMLTAQLENQRQGLSFYDFQTGTWVQTHEAQPGESIITAERNPFSRNSENVAIGLHSGDSWRVLAFETATGNVVGQLDNTNHV